MERILRIYFFTFCLLITAVVNAQVIKAWKLADLKYAMADSKEPLVINFWATFCKPCIAELPHFQAVADSYKTKGVKVVFVSLDLKEAYPAKISTLIKKLSITSPVVFLDESDADLFCPAVDSSWSGAIPASLFINNRKGYKKFFEEELSKEKLEAEIKKML